MQSDPAALRSLAGEIERAEGPSRELDARIFAAVHPDEVPSPIVERGYGWRYERGLWWLATGEDSRTPPKTVSPPHYTTSLDAAMTLIPAGHDYILEHVNGGLTISAMVGHNDRERASWGETDELALAAAALRAAARSCGEKGDD